MTIINAIILGIVEGLTEFLPISSTGHLTIVEKLLGYHIDGIGITAFTAIIQIGTIIATLVYFRADIVRIVLAWLRGLRNKQKRGVDYRLGWAIIIGSVPIAVIGLLFKHQIETSLRSLWFVAAGLIGWSLVMFVADRATGRRNQEQATWRDTLIIGITQCAALIPGVSRSGATISAGLLRGLDRVSATQLSFFLAIPALLAAGLLQAVSEAGNIGTTVGWPATITATVVSGIVGYASIAWLLRYVRGHRFTVFIVYRITIGLVLIGLLMTGLITAT